MVEVHYHGSTEDDEACCGEPVLSGGTYSPEKVTCRACLNSLVAIGRVAAARLSVLEGEMP